jgi:hypothetical protein
MALFMTTLLLWLASVFAWAVLLTAIGVQVALDLVLLSLALGSVTSTALFLVLWRGSR